ncbi:MAG TPA: NTP transferase domain-containing protein [Acidimicrobiales bacterium]|nr:NTP transferase domain-containing protein [Acidimicrobiales bacterium]
MHAMQLVVLAAGHGRRFGGLKQLAPVGPKGEAIMDYTARAAESCGVTGMVVVIRKEIRSQVAAHVRRFWPTSLPVEFVEQPPIPGTAQAVYATHEVIDGTFGVANADDLYGDAAIGALHRAIDLYAGDEDTHVLVGYELLQTVLTSQPVTRGLIEIGEDGHLAGIAEHTIALRPDGQYDSRPLWSIEPHETRTFAELAPRKLTGSERVSMNLWGFHQRIFQHLADALEAFHPETAARSELLLPDVIGHLVATGTDRVQVLPTDGRCMGITNADDLPILQGELALSTEARPRANLRAKERGAV